MKKILIVLPSLTQSNGITSYCWNYLKKIDKNDVKIDILSSDKRPSQLFLDFCNENNINVYFYQNIKKGGLLNYIKFIKKFFKENHDYDVVHCNVINHGLFILKEAKKYRIKKRVLHSHATKASEKKINNIINKFISKRAIKLSTHYFACSCLAGNYLYGKKEYQVINNAIEFDKYAFNKEYRKEIREKLKISEDTCIVGFVGRLSKQKNPIYLLNVFKNYHDLNPNSILVIIGINYMKDEINKEIENLSIQENVLLLSEIYDVYKYYSAFDFFLLPSFYEGLPVVGVEAQASGLHCIFSSNITEEVKYSPNLVFMDITSLPITWANQMIKTEYKNRKNYYSSDFDIIYQAKVLESFYKEHER